jgi:radical SAM superfamily enzyme YgiQ (UPF0313 family)
MKLILVLNSPLFSEQTITNSEDYLPPIGLGIVASALELENKIVFIDLIADNYSIPMAIDKISEIKPDIVCINIFTTNYLIVKSIVENDTTSHKWIIGGLSTKAFYIDIFNWKTNNQIDIVCGDGDNIIVDLVDNKTAEPPFEEVENRRYYCVNKISTYYVSNLNNEKLNRCLFVHEPYKNVYNELEVSIYASRGCPHNCAFCGAAQSRNSEMGVRRKSEAKIISELVSIKNKHWNVDCIRILDDLFLANKDCMIIAARIFKHFDYKWRAMCHIQSLNMVNESLLKDLKDSGCKELFIGIESGSPRILKKLHKTEDLAVIEESLSKLFSVGIAAKGYFVCGIPSETEEDLQLTYELASNIKSQAMSKNSIFRVSCFQFRPYCGTELYDEIINQTGEDYYSILHKTMESNENTGRKTFNFSSGNYSSVSDETLTMYINKLNELNG